MRHVAIAVGAFMLATALQIFASPEVTAAQHGKASYYWQPQAVASGGRFNPNAMTAAHKTLPFGTRVRVTRKSTGRSVVVIINDRGPYIKGRIIDLSRAAAKRLGMTAAGVTSVRVDIIGKGSLKKASLKKASPKKKPTGSSHKPTKKLAKKSTKKVSKRLASSPQIRKKKPKRIASVARRSKKKASHRKRARKQRFAGIPKSLRGKKIISVKRRYSIGGKTRTTSGRIPRGATLLMEEITYIN
jgi:rare lipoprotein A